MIGWKYTLVPGNQFITAAYCKWHWCWALSALLLRHATGGSGGQGGGEDEWLQIYIFGGEISCPQEQKHKVKEELHLSSW